MAGTSDWKWFPMKVIPHDNIHAFLVTSDGTDEEMAGSSYLVRLDEHRGVGECSCKSWHCRVWPKIRDGVKPDGLFDPDFACKHLTAARRYQYGEFFRALILKDMTHSRNHEDHEQRTIPTQLAGR